MSWEIRQGDCRELLGAMPLGSVDICVFSPPYNVCGERGYPGGDSANRGMHEGKRVVDGLVGMGWDYKPEAEYQEWLVEIIGECLRVSKGLVWVNHKTRFREGEGLHPLLFLPFPIWSEVVWDRGGSMALNCRRFAPSHEYFWGFGKPHFWDDRENGLCSVWRVGQVTGSEHPCPYPEELVRRIVRASCPEGGLVLDPFVGSGTTGAACVEMGRDFLGFELDPGYCELARRRLAGAQEPLLTV